MKLGIVVDGVSEYASLGPVVLKIAARSGDHYLRIVKADIQPMAPFAVIARSCRPVVTQLVSRGADRVIVLLDREERHECPPLIAAGIQRALAPQVDCPVTVVVKDQSYENWLISDLEALERHPARFSVTRAHRARVEPNRADQVDARILFRAIAKRGYEKVDDSKVILATADPDRMGLHSRSFRKFLREARYPRYQAQSHAP